MVHVHRGGGGGERKEGFFVVDVNSCGTVGCEVYLSLYLYRVEQKKGCQVARKLCLVAPGGCLAERDLFSSIISDIILLLTANLQRLFVTIQE